MGDLSEQPDRPGDPERPGGGPTAAEQSVVSSFTLFALQSRSIMATVEQGVAVATGALGASAGAVVRLRGSGQAALVYGRGPGGVSLGLSGRLFGGLLGGPPGGLLGGPPGDPPGDPSHGLSGGEVFEADPDLLLAPVSRQPLGLARLYSHLCRPAGGGSEPAVLSVLVTVEGTAWGRLTVADRFGRTFDAAAEGFLRRIAGVLGAAVERERLDRGQAVLADLGAVVLRSVETSDVIDAAIDAVMRVAEAPTGAVVRALPGTPPMATLVRTRGPAAPIAGREYEIDVRLAAHLGRSEPLVVEDWANDERFGSALLPGTEVSVACLATAVHVGGRTWGWLVASDTRPRRFSRRDVEAAASVASLLSAALAEGGPAEGRPAERRGRVPGRRHEPVPSPAGSSTEVALLDPVGVIVWVNQAWRDFAAANGGDPRRTGVGVSYLECCEQAHDPVADQVADAVRTAVRGDLPAPMTLLIPCHGPKSARWFDVLVSSRFDDDGECLGASVTLSRAVP